MTEFNWADYLLIALLGLSTIVSLFRGFFKEALSLAGWIVSLWIAWRIGPVAAPILESSVADPVLRLWVARFLLFIVALLICGIISRLVSALVSSSGLTGTDRMLGMVFGFGRGVVLAGILVATLDMLGFSESAWWQESKLIPYASPVAEIIRHAGEDGLEYIGGMELPVDS
jgi:membrane protein required for colicin V production